MSKIILLNKPYGYLSQFTDNDGHLGLKHICPIPGVYPAGRLDRDSEGLMILTDDGKLQAKISHPKHKLAKTYWVQVEGEVTAQHIQQLSKGVELKDGLTAPAKVKQITAPDIWPRNPPVRERKNIPDNWLQITITEGKNRQVRRMTASVGLPTLRLIRSQIGQWALDNLQPGEYQELSIHLPKQASKRYTNKKGAARG